MATSYDELVANVPLTLYAQNQTIVASMPDIIRQAEDQVYLMLDHDLFQTILTGYSLTSGVSVLDLSAAPGLFEIRSVRWRYDSDANQMVPLERRNLEMLSMLYSDNVPAAVPRYWTQYGATDIIKVFPVPNATLTIDVTANVQPAYLAPGTQTNVVTDEFPRVIEKACLRQAALFMKNTQDAQMYEKEMMDALNEANSMIRRRRGAETGVITRETSNSGGIPQ